ncbi:bacteriocin immunity protein [Bacillus infantis]|uniref:bacteriocin immunity protein n=1 Tax=Bacillus infantis TaxID=324767 RepID=UPI003CFA8DE4
MQINREELVKAVEKIMNADGTEKELDSLLDMLEKNVPHPNVNDLIFWNEEDLSAEEIVDEALNYKPFLLP